MKNSRIIFMGTPDFAAVALKALCESGQEVIAVYTQPPRPKGRGHTLQNSPVHEYALSKNIPVFHPASLKKEDEQEKFAALVKKSGADIAVVAAYGLILPKAVLNAPRLGCVNIHASLLPRWRGASPIQRAIWAGDKDTGVTLMQMDEGLDTGPMIEKRAVKMTAGTTSSSLHDELAALGGTMIIDFVNKLARGEKINAQPQDNALSTYAPLLKKDDGRVNWSQSAQEIDRQIRALNPWPGVWTMASGKRLKIIQAEILLRNEKAQAGKILNKQGHVSCGDGALTLIKIQPENAKAMDFTAALNGGYLSIGDVFA